MPPNRHHKIEIDPIAKEALETLLKLKAPVSIKIDMADQTKHCGLYESSPKRLITLFVGLRTLRNTRLVHVKHDLLDTLLHEFRHAHQFDHWPPEKCNSVALIEQDAEDWAKKNRADWGCLFRIRPVSRSPLGRLSEAEGRVR